MPRRVKHPDAEARDIERLAVFEGLVVSDVPFGICAVHVDRGACLSAHRLQGIHVVGVTVRYQDRRHRGPGSAEDFLRLGAGVDNDVALRSVDHIGVDLEAVHRECDLLDLAHRRSSTCCTLADLNANLLRAVLSSMVSTLAETMLTPASEMVAVMSFNRCILSRASTSSSTVKSLSDPLAHSTSTKRSGSLACSAVAFTQPAE